MINLLLCLYFKVYVGLYKKKQQQKQCTLTLKITDYYKTKLMTSLERIKKGDLFMT